ncbi:5-formyltetrahydrofolate cyclo-ligase [Actinobacillus equuli]|nr:5-formyltetrahydrofolate cyclo-ligase [Actinobacillus equuli]
MQQPKLDIRQLKPLEELEMIFTPLLACDSQLNRLGYGGGFYDRTLAQTQAISVGLAYRCQLIEQLPVEPWDMPLNHLILGDTE